MARNKLAVFSLVSMLALLCNQAVCAQGGIDLDTYTCSQFLADAKAPADGSRLLRSMMMVSWATGYAAAHQQGVTRADSKALELIGAALVLLCY